MTYMQYIYRSIFAVVLLTVLGYAGYRLWDAVQGLRAHTTYSVDTVYGHDNIVPVAIVGSGPAGFAAAMYASRGAYHTVIFEGDLPGGQLMTTTWVENWPAVHKQYGPDIMEKARNQAKSFGARSSREAIVDVDTTVWPYTLTTASGDSIRALTIIWSTGATPRMLGVPGEQVYWGNGVTTCAVCDAPFHKGDRVCVVGGGDSAVEEALELAPYAREVIMMVRRDVMRASPIMQKQLDAYDHIHVWYNTQIQEIHGDEDKVTGVTVSQDGETFEVSLGGVFLAIGQDPNTQLLQGIVDRDERAYVYVQGRSQQTSCPAIFAAGDVEDDMYKQAGVAAGSGIKAALDAAEFLRNVGYNEHVEKQIADTLYDPDIEAQRAPLPDLYSMDDYREYVLHADKPVIIDCYTEFCPSCEAMMPHMEYISARFSDQLACFKLNVQKSLEVAKALGVEQKGVPRILVYKNGKQVQQIPHKLSRTELVKLAQDVIAD